MKILMRLFALTALLVLITLLASTSSTWDMGSISFPGNLPKLINNTSTSSISRPIITSISPSISRIIAESEKIRERFLKKRQHLFEKSTSSLSDVKPWGSTVVFWDYFIPTFRCPYSVERIGRLGDGGKWVCGFEFFENITRGQKPCVVYSFGIGRESSFESEFLERTPCSIYGYDHTITNGFVEDGQYLTEKYGPSRINFFKKKLISKSGFQFFAGRKISNTLGGFMKDSGHTWIDFLKVDIEGDEYAILDQILEEFNGSLPFGHLNLEIHIKEFEKAEAKKEGEQFKSFYEWWTRLEESGLRAHTWEVNHFPCVSNKRKPNAFEYSFVNIKKLIYDVI